MSRKIRRWTTVASTALLAAAVALPASAASAAPRPASEPAPAGNVDVARYLGSWYQVAAVPALFEAQCKKNARAEYGLTPRGTVSVENSCDTWFGTRSTVKGDAKPLDGSNARLNVSFLGLNGTYAHSSRANYIVVGLDEDYTWAAVTDADRRSAFVLSRTPALSAGQASAAGEALRAAGVDPCSVKYTPQDGGSASRAPFC
ncbi:lipocalin family protein [Streptomyces sp. NPDC058459]|uniref:lipocalin family protein n=1 Tax=Streptomyces sp. NPDC058459 TaxID=3346508 RepID=UPI003666855E